MQLVIYAAVHNRQAQTASYRMHVMQDCPPAGIGVKLHVPKHGHSYIMSYLGCKRSQDLKHEVCFQRQSSSWGAQLQMSAATSGKGTKREVDKKLERKRSLVFACEDNIQAWILCGAAVGNAMRETRNGT